MYSEIVRDSPIYSIYLYILPYTFIHLYVPFYTSNTPEYFYIPFSPIYIQISNIRNMRSDIRPQNGHNSGPRGSPMARSWHAPSYHTPKGFSMPKGPPF